MTTFYITCAVAGGIFVVLQSVFGLFGDHDSDHHEVSDALDIISLRTVAAGITAFGLAGGGPSIVSAFGGQSAWFWLPWSGSR